MEATAAPEAMAARQARVRRVPADPMRAPPVRPARGPLVRPVGPEAREAAGREEREGRARASPGRRLHRCFRGSTAPTDRVEQEDREDPAGVEQAPPGRPAPPQCRSRLPEPPAFWGSYSIRINDQWRILFEWTEQGPSRVRIADYH